MGLPAKSPCSREEVVPLAKARDTSIFGSKAVGLVAAARACLPILPGVALFGLDCRSRCE